MLLPSSPIFSCLCSMQKWIFLAYSDGPGWFEMIGLKEIYRHRSYSDAKTPGNESPDPLTWRPLFSDQFFSTFAGTNTKIQNSNMPGECIRKFFPKRKYFIFGLQMIKTSYSILRRCQKTSWTVLSRSNQRNSVPIFSLKDQDHNRGNHCHWQPWVPFVQSISLCPCVVGLWLYPGFISNFVYICV